MPNLQLVMVLLPKLSHLLATKARRSADNGGGQINFSFIHQFGLNWGEKEAANPESLSPVWRPGNRAFLLLTAMPLLTPHDKLHAL